MPVKVKVLCVDCFWCNFDGTCGNHCEPSDDPHVCDGFDAIDCDDPTERRAADEVAEAEAEAEEPPRLGTFKKIGRPVLPTKSRE